MTKPWRNLSIVLASLCIGFSTSYANPDFLKNTAFILGGELGIVSSDLPDLPLQGNDNTSRNPTLKAEGPDQSLHPLGWGVHAGVEFLQAHHFSVGGEANYQNFGEFDYKLSNSAAAQEYVGPVAKREIRVYSWATLLTMRYQWVHGINLFAKIGPAWVRTKVKQENVISFRYPQDSNMLYDVNDSFYNIEPEMVLGVGFRFHRYVNIYTSYTHINGNSPSSYSSGQEDALAQISRAPEINMVAIGASIIV